MSSSPRRLLSLFLIAISAAAVTALLVVTPASAHNVLVASTPSAGEVLSELPEVFSVTTNEPMLALEGSQGFALQVRDEAGFYYGDGCVEVVDATMSAIAAPLGASGEYTMLWQAVSADGHTISGEIPFSWRPLGAVGAAPRSATPPVCGEAGAPGESASPAPLIPDPPADDGDASGVDVATVIWISGGLLALGIGIAIAIAVASRRRAA